MEINVPVFNKISLMIGNKSRNGDNYPTGQLQKGLLLLHDGVNLSEEAVGFGVPVIKQGIKTIFAGNAELSYRECDSFVEITAIYHMNLQEKVGKISSGNIKSNLLYFVKSFLAALHRNVPALREFLMAVSNLLLRIFKWEIRFELEDFSAQIKVVYAIFREGGRIEVEVYLTDALENEITEVVVMNEQSAHFFDRYLDSSGLKLEGERIGSWDEVKAQKASFLCPQHQIMFSLSTIENAKLFRGQELIGSRLAWSGFGYSFSPLVKNFCYELRLEKVQ